MHSLTHSLTYSHIHLHTHIHTHLPQNKREMKNLILPYKMNKKALILGVFSASIVFYYLEPREKYPLAIFLAAVCSVL